MTKKIKALVITVALLIGLLPGVALARGGVPHGVTLEGWVAGPNGNGTSISFGYSDGFGTDLFISIPYNSSWKKVNPVEPILQAYKEGYGPNLGGEGGILGTTINFAPNVLAAMKSQNFNPAEVGGASIPPESTALNDDQIAWLQKGGYTVPAETTAPKPLAEAEPAPVQPEPELPINTGQVNAVTEPVNLSTVPTQSESEPKADPSDSVGQTVKTPDTPMTEEMVTENQKLVTQDPPKVNEPPVPVASIPVQAPEPEQSNTNLMMWLGVVVAVVVLASVGAVFIRKKA
ncbi:hypothetical protein Desde_3177 [Desulfitobacterium dehalogenans ATCC 51507]|uniref:Uncharacterized protein n=1 Tax=Desulfitobacterium dehalogenans (strain ATCC 51507 / DSM 9161 / JW/IU-DC1) TaxID=756499 RepID=I4ABY3_DESDJ|nr:hypothetical protein [Desulfitobacterium dehalogenans]AFM01468.1 hypothetical protein Desde_3177 [Desulfitobacterium dehalogenans ATCC 51507]